MVEGQFALAPSLAAGAAGLVDVAQARIQLVRSSNSEVALDTVISVDADSIDISVTVMVSSSSETFVLTLTLLNPSGAVVFQAGPITVTATVATDTAPEPVEVPLQYVGTGSDAVDVQIINAPTRIFSGDTVQFVAVALDEAGTPIENTPIGWRSTDPTRAVVLDIRTGLVVGTSNAGQVQIEAFLLTGQTAAVALAVTQLTAVVSVTPTTTSVNAGSTVQFTAEARDGNDVVITDVKFIWLSGNQAIATIDTSGLALGRADGAVTITAAAQGVPGNAVLTVTGGPPPPGDVTPTQIVFLEQPTNRIAGQAMSPAVSVALQDASGTLATSATDVVTLSLGNNPGNGTLAGTLSLRAAGGIASFSGLSIDKVGTGYTLTATSGTFTPITTGAFDVSAAAADMLVFATEPPTSEALSPFNTTVEIQDAFGNLVPSATDEVLILLITTDSDADLIGPATVSAVSGLASFMGMRVDRAGSGNFLLATSGSLGTATSQTFDITFTWGGVVASGEEHNCALQINGFAYCWGDGEKGQLGPNTEFSFTDFASFQPIVQVIDQDYVSLVAGDDTTCGFTPAGGWLCWGELPGADASQDFETPFPTPIPGGIAFQTLAIGRSQHVCGITAASETYCWGEGFSGALGNGTQSFSGVPVLVSGNLSFTSVALGSRAAACALTVAGQAYCWGDNREGLLGIVSSESCTDPFDPTQPFPCNTTPTLVSGGITFTSIVSGSFHRCGLDASGDAYCWGSNLVGQLGTTTAETCASFFDPTLLFPCSTTPVQVSGGFTFTALFGGSKANHTCGLTANGDAYCWGLNASSTFLGQDGRLGSVTTELCQIQDPFDPFGQPADISCSRTPLLVSGGLSWVTISLGEEHTCGVTASNEPYCWGDNDEGQLGNGNPSVSSSSLPVKVIDP